MGKVKLTKGELKRQRDALKQYERYLPTLQLKKLKLQAEILEQVAILDKKIKAESGMIDAIKPWAGLLTADGIDVRPLVKPKNIITLIRNIAGADLLLFERAEFESAEYDLFITPLWVDAAVDALRELISLKKEIEIIKRSIEILREELRITTQRVNLFEKIKIPEAKEAIHLIRIYIGDQMANAVGRSKAAKRKIESALLLEEVMQ